MSKRRIALVVGLAGLLAMSGCLGFITGSESLSFESDTVAVDSGTQDDTGYEEVRRESTTITKSYTVAGQTRNVTVTNHVAEYARKVKAPVLGEQQAARFTVLATPQVTIAGQGPFNPVGDFSNRELAMRLQEQYETVKNVRFEENRTRTMLGKETTVSKYRADAKTGSGQSVEVFLHITKVEHEDDFVIAVAVYPTALDSEEEQVDTMLSGIDHPA